MSHIILTHISSRHLRSDQLSETMDFWISTVVFLSLPFSTAREVISPSTYHGSFILRSGLNWAGIMDARQPLSLLSFTSLEICTVEAGISLPLTDITSSPYSFSTLLSPLWVLYVSVLLDYMISVGLSSISQQGIPFLSCHAQSQAS